MRYVYFATFFVVVLAVSVLGLRGTRFTHPPLELFPDMNHQAHLKPQATSSLFADDRADRPIPPHTVPAGTPLDDDDALFRGKAADGSFVTAIPAAVKVDPALLVRGQDRFTIYCQPCHGALGDGQGITKQYGMTTGELFSTITNGSVKTPEGKQNMLPYADKLTVPDRWAVVAYVRALQRAQNGSINDVTDPAEKAKLLSTK